MRCSKARRPDAHTRSRLHHLGEAEDCLMGEFFLIPPHFPLQRACARPQTFLFSRGAQRGPTKFELLVKVVKAARSRKAQRPAARDALAASGATLLLVTVPRSTPIRTRLFSRHMHIDRAVES
jgi:hypothetical protein